MRLSLEWLLLPLCLLPLLAAGAFHVWAQRSWDREQGSYLEGGEAKARAWLDVAETRERLRAEFLAPPAKPFGIVNEPSGRIRFRLDGADGTFLAGLEGIHMRVFPLGTPPPWQFTMSPPTGLTPTALSQTNTRLAVEVGAAPAQLDAEWIDTGTQQFAALLRTPDMRALRTASLPAATKRFLLQRWIRGGFSHLHASATLAWLDVMVRFQRWFAQHGHTAGIGFHPLDELAVGVRGTPARYFTIAEAAPPSALVIDAPLVDGFAVVAGPEGYEGNISLYGSPGPRRADRSARILWTGWLDGPVAGHWTFMSRYGPNWWQVPRLRRWIGPAMLWLFGFLLLEAALWLALRKRRRLDDARSRFINEIAHDLRTPLTSLRLYTDLLARGQASEEDRTRYIGVMERESARLSALLGNVLDLSRLEDGRRSLLAEPLALGPLVETAVRDFALLFPQRGSDLQVSAPEDVQVRGDAAGISRCIANLLDNAGKYTDAGTAIHLTVAQDEPHVLVRVADEGPGIPPGERAQVFARYQRGRRGQRDGVPGTGLGLALVKELATAMGGSVRLGAPEVGAAFELRLPGGADV